MKVTIILIVTGDLGTVTKGLIMGLEDLEIRRKVETIKLLHYWDRSKYCEGSWRLEETCCHSNSSERPSANAAVKNSQGVSNNNNDKWWITGVWKLGSSGL